MHINCTLLSRPQSREIVIRHHLITADFQKVVAREYISCPNMPFLVCVSLPYNILYFDDKLSQNFEGQLKFITSFNAETLLFLCRI